MSVKLDDTDQSYELGRFVGVIRQMEEELKLTLEGVENIVEDALANFIESPADALDDCQIQLIQTQKRIRALGRPELLQDIREVFELIDVPFLGEIKLHEENFMNGYESQRRAYQQ